MPRNLLSVVEEFRRSPDVQYRKNAVTALAVIADDEAVSQLVEVALTDPEMGVRERAEQEIRNLEPDVKNRAVDTLKRAFADTQRRQAAYGILGRLRSHGLSVRFSRRPYLTWVRLTQGLNRYIYPLRSWKFRLRSWKSGLLGGVAGVVFLLMFFLRTGDLNDYRGFTSILVGLLLLSPAVAVLATQRTSPINLYLDHLVGFLTEIVSPIVFVSLGFLLILFVLLLTSTRFFREDWWVLGLSLALGALASVVRGGTLIAYGRFLERRTNWLAQVVVGVATGFLALTIANYFAWVIVPANDEINVAWILLLPMSFVAANAFASIDNETSPIRPFVGRMGTVLCILILLPFIAITTFVFKHGRNAYDSHRGPNLNRVFEEILFSSALTPSSPTPTSSPEDCQRINGIAHSDFLGIEDTGSASRQARSGLVGVIVCKSPQRLKN